MDTVGMLGDDFVADVPDRFRRIHRRDARIMFAEPREQARFRTPDHGADRPQRVIEIDCYGANAAHVLLTVRELSNIAT